MKRGYFLPVFGFCGLLAALLMFPVPVREALADSLRYCLGVLVPSIFPFLFLSSYAVRSPAAQVLGRPLGFLVRRVFRLPECCAVPLLMGLLGGYPAGARGASLLLEEGQITGEQAGRMLCFLVSPGLGFTVTFLGGLLGFRLGWLLFWSVTLPAVLLGAVSGLTAHIPQKAGPEKALPASGNLALSRSVSDASRGLLGMCAWILLFAGLNAVLRASGAFAGLTRLLSLTRLFAPTEWTAILSFLLEVTGGIGDASSLRAGPAFLAFGLGFGGLCVHMQLRSMFQDPPAGLPRFLLWRTAHGVLSAGTFLLLSRIFAGDGALPAVSGLSSVSLSAPWLGGASLVLMCAAFLLSLPSVRRRS